ncbi:hypothetical protein Pcinc_028164 [Petrolisthes cinctipes]|uniref:PLOD1-3-like GT domain-containing protein n=1 Tax=Petrolisthes cinctipes TaxID=88211 RepID=A0AAE1K9B9_PETCI|nr:hypothetical protein Pcinc_028164 [Petrolisthes cinctipes]
MASLPPVLFSIIIVLYCTCQPTYSSTDRDLLVLTVATTETDGFVRYMRSLHIYNLDAKVLGMNQEWEGGDMTNDVGGGQKVNILKQELEKYKDDKNKVIIFTDSYDVIFTSGKAVILDNFDTFDARVVFGAEDYCWPKKDLASQYPRVSFGYKYLNSGGFIGYAPELYKIVTSHDITNQDDDQLYYTKVYLDKQLRENYSIKLDTQAKIFQNLNGQFGDVSMKIGEGDVQIVNTVYQTTPLVIHGNGPTKVLLNSLGNYLAKSWTPEDGCLACIEDKKDISALKKDDYPVVLLAVFVEKPVPFLEEMLEKVANLSYPKQRMDLLVHNQVELHKELVSNWVEAQESAGYRSVQQQPYDLKEWHARNNAVDVCLKNDCDVFFSVDGEVHFDNPDTLTLLLKHNRPVLAAMMTRDGQAWSTFWGAVNDEGFYARSNDYMDISNNNRR